MRDYRPLVSRTAPEGLLAFAFEHAALDTAGLVYRTAWVTSTDFDSVLITPGKKEKAVRCTCSECQQTFLMAYAPPDYGYHGGKACYGFYDYVTQGAERVGDGDGTLCPECGAPVKVRCAARVGRGEFMSDECCVVSASVLDGPPGEKPLVLTQWRIRRMVSRDGCERYIKDPLEAYIFDGQSAYKLNGWVKAYGGHTGYFLQVSSKWRQPVEWSETMGRVDAIFGLTPELLEESCMHNSKLDLYMAGDVRGRGKAPVVYLRLYQLYPQVENLVVQNCAHILDALFRRRMDSSYWEDNKRGFCPTPELDLTQQRPDQLLGLNKDEFALMREQCWDAYHWELYVKAKRAGDCLTPEDIVDIHRYGGEDLDGLIGRAPLGKCVRYLLEQMLWVCAMNDPYNEFGDELLVDEEIIDAVMLSDYWDMAADVGWDLGNSQIKWPQDLIAAHDRAMLAQSAKQDKQTRANFRKRYKALSAKYSYASGTLMIVPAKNQKELTREGNKLSHCVAGYGKDHAAGKTAIFFIRRPWAPEEPYYTLELNEGEEKVRQNRGKRNCDRTPEVQAFEEEWLTWIHKGCPRNEDGTPVGAMPVVTKDPAAAEEQKKEAQVA